jgi:hypothetical protein
MTFAVTQMMGHDESENPQLERVVYSFTLTETSRSEAADEAALVALFA